jgi:hypothetical protein
MSRYYNNNMTVNDVDALCYDYFHGAGAYNNQNMAFQSYLSHATSPSIGYGTNGASGANGTNGTNGTRNSTPKSMYDSNGFYSSARLM